MFSVMKEKVHAYLLLACSRRSPVDRDQRLDIPIMKKWQVAHSLYDNLCFSFPRLTPVASTRDGEIDGRTVVDDVKAIVA